MYTRFVYGEVGAYRHFLSGWESLDVDDTMLGCRDTGRCSTPAALTILVVAFCRHIVVGNTRYQKSEVENMFDDPAVFSSRLLQFPSAPSSVHVGSSQQGVAIPREKCRPPCWPVFSLCRVRTSRQCVCSHSLFLGPGLVRNCLSTAKLCTV